MGFLEDAKKYITEKQSTNSTCRNDDILQLNTRAQEEELFNALRKLYENATRLEIERAIDSVKQKLEKPYSKKEFMKNLRVKLED